MTKNEDSSEHDEDAQSRDLTLIRVPIDEVVTGANRPLDQEVVANLKMSMAEIGLKTPITIMITKRGIEPDGPFVTDHRLIAGRHRLEAAKQLGWTEIDAFVLEGDQIDAELWELDENTQRKELSAMERADNVRRRTDLVKKRNGQVVQSGGEAPRGLIAETARALSIPGKSEGARRKIVERSLKIADIAPEAKEAAKDADLADNQQALIEIAGEPNAEAQVRKVGEIKSRARDKQKKRKQKKTRRADLPTEPASSQGAEGADGALRKAFANAGHDISFDDIIFVADSKSAGAQPSEYALVRIPPRLTTDQQIAMKKQLLKFRGEPYHTQVQFGVLPKPASQTTCGGDSEDDEADSE